MFASSGLDAGLLIGTEYVITQSQSCTLPATLIEVEDAAGFAGEVGITRQDPGAVTPGAQGVLTEPAPEGGAADFATRPRAIASWRNSASGQRANGSPRRDGSSHANALSFGFGIRAPGPS